MKKQKVLVLAYSDVNYDPRIMKQCTALSNEGYDVSFHGIKYDQISHVNPFNTYLHFKRSPKNYFQYIQYFLLMLIFFFIQFKFVFSKPIVIVHNMPNFLVFSSLLFRLFGTKIVLDVHDDSVLVLSKTTKNKFLLFMFDKVDNFLSLKVPDRLMTVNRVIAKDLKKSTCKNILTLHNSPEKIVNQCSKTYTPGESIKLVYIGNVGTHYGLESFIQYVHKVKEFIPLSFDIYGDGAAKEGLEKLIDDLQLNSIVKVHGRYMANEVDDILKSYHLGVAMYNQNELTNIILPVKILEYTFNCLPTITVPLRVTTEYFGKDSLVYVNSYTEFKEAMEAIYYNSIRLDEVHKKALSDVDRISWEKEKPLFLNYIKGLL